MLFQQFTLYYFRTFQKQNNLISKKRNLMYHLEQRKSKLSAESFNMRKMKIVQKK